MSKQEIKIIVSGTAGVGKSTVGMIVQSALEQCGIETKLFDVEEHLDEFTEPAIIVRRIDSIAEKTAVRIEIAMKHRRS